MTKCTPIPKSVLYSIFLASAILAWQPSNAELKPSASGDTVFDTDRKLEWVRDADLAGQQMTWAEADVWAANLQFDGHSDWRLPSGLDASGGVCDSFPQPGESTSNCEEADLGHLYHVHGIKPTNQGPFQNLLAGDYWTSSTAQDDASRAMAFNMDLLGSGGEGAQNTRPKDTQARAWAVRGAQRTFPAIFERYGWLIAALLLGAVFGGIWMRRKNKP